MKYMKYMATLKMPKNVPFDDKKELPLREVGANQISMKNSTIVDLRLMLVVKLGNILLVYFYTTILNTSLPVHMVLTTRLH